MGRLSAVALGNSSDSVILPEVLKFWGESRLNGAVIRPDGGFVPKQMALEELNNLIREIRKKGWDKTPLFGNYQYSLTADQQHS